MSTLRLRQLGRHIPLWRRRVPQYPEYWKGNPQLREFLPLFWARIVKPDIKMPPNTVLFEAHPQMNKADIQQYLEKIYDLPIQHVHTYNIPGEFVDSYTGYRLDRKPDRNMANIQLKDGHTFEFPDVFEKPGKSSIEMEQKEYEKQQRKIKREQHKSWHMADLPSWFRS